jgi:NAD(P)-dependent dehydrogenase (short-subunit alcohol dehydrogenase family)
MRLREKVAIVTGAGTGIGKAIAIRFAREGARVVVNGRRAGPLDAVVDEIVQGDGTALSVVGDVTRATDVERMVRATVGSFGRLDVLVNNAGTIPERGAVGDLTEEGFRKTLDGNLVSTFLCSKAALPELLKTRGNIVNVASLAGLRGTPNLAAYGAAKGGVVVLTKDMAVDYAGRGVRVNCICPAYVETDLNRDFLSRLKDTGAYEDLVRLHPLGFLGAPEDVAHGAVYLASDEARWITGIALVIDGGISASR